MAARKKSEQADPVVDALATVKAQIKDAGADLRRYRPEAIDWLSRATAAAEKWVPWLRSVAPGLKNHVQDVFNAPLLLLSMWEALRPHVNAPKEQVEAFERQLRLDDILRASVTGEVVSNVVTKYLLECDPNRTLKANGRSDYPDIYDSAADYTKLSGFKRVKQKSAEDVYGASLKGKTTRRPARVPDGLEIKTCKNRIKVDCHHPHVGLHLVIVFTMSNRVLAVSDIRVAFLRIDDYYEAARNTTATTVKYSFNGDSFISVLNAS